MGCSDGSPERPVGVGRMWAPGDHETNDSHAPLPARPATPGPPRNTMLRRAVARPGTLNPRAPQPNSSNVGIPSQPKLDPPPRQPKLLDRPRDALRSHHNSRFGIPPQHSCCKRARYPDPPGASRAQGCEDNHDLRLCPQPRREGAPKSCGGPVMNLPRPGVMRKPDTQ